MARRNKLVRLDRVVVMIVAAVFAVLAGCGGQSERHGGDSGSEDDDTSGSGGSSVGGTSVGGTSGTGGNGGCIFNGNYYAYGESFPAPDGCNWCTCIQEDVVGCSDSDCQRSCSYNGLLVAHGSSFSVQGGCGTCHCDDGNVTCVSVPCPETRCEMLWSWYAERVTFGAKRCDPATGAGCMYLVNSTLPCGCQTFVNDAADLEAWKDEWELLDCGSPTPCVPCPPPPNQAFCSLEGVCGDVY